MTTLGDRLKAQNTAREETAQAQRIARTMAEQRKLEQDAAKISKFCEEVKDVIVSGIELDVVIPATRVPRYEPFDTYAWFNSSQDRRPYRHNTHASIFDGLVEWGKQNGLNIRFVYEHDGCGMESWYSVTVVPL